MWYILALVLILETNKPEILVNMSVVFQTEEHCNNFIKTYKSAMLTQFKSSSKLIQSRQSETGQDTLSSQHFLAHSIISLGVPVR